jgi:hypothetical protein
MTRHPTEGEGQLHTLGLLKQLRCECKGLWGASSGAYFRVDTLLRQLADPNLHDIPNNLPFRVEMWDREQIRWVIAASASVAVGHAALDAALRNGALVIRRSPWQSEKRTMAKTVSERIGRWLSGIEFISECC